MALQDTLLIILVVLSTIAYVLSLLIIFVDYGDTGIAGPKGKIGQTSIKGKRGPPGVGTDGDDACNNAIYLDTSTAYFTPTEYYDRSENCNKVFYQRINIENFNDDDADNRGGAKGLSEAFDDGVLVTSIVCGENSNNTNLDSFLDQGGQLYQTAYNEGINVRYLENSTTWTSWARYHQ